MESAMNHPCQALADWKTMDELGVPRRGKFVLSWVNHPRALPLAVPSATVHMAAMRGMDVVVLRPEGFELPPQSWTRHAPRRGELGRFGARDLRPRRGARGRARHLRQGMGLDHALRRRRRRRQAARRQLADWCVRDPGSRPPRRLPLHALPAGAPQRRGGRRVLDGPRSVVQREAYNRITAQMAVLHRLLGP
jgi:N-acetylornithine carbamoyltransferase